MSSTVGIIAYYAIEAPKSVFYEPSGPPQTACGAYPKEHPTAPQAKFCEHCGRATKPFQPLKPTETFLEVCQKHGVPLGEKVECRLGDADVRLEAADHDLADRGRDRP